MVSDSDVWNYIRTIEGFTRFSTIKTALGLSPQRLTNALRRLEKSGEILRHVGYYKERPVNEYLAIDVKDPRFSARIVDDHGWLYTWLEWQHTDGSSLSISINLGELAEYLTSWPGWVETLREAGKLRFEEIPWETGNPANPVRSLRDLAETRSHRFLS